MRVAIAAFALESVSFLPGVTDIAEFERSAHRGRDLIEALRGTESVVGGFIDVLEDEEADLVPLVHADAYAAGNASDAAFEKYRDEIVNGILAEGGSLEGVLLFLHGAMTTPTRTDPELELVRSLRKAIGPDIPLMIALDLHGNLDPEMAELCTAMFGYHYSPHTDMAETGRRAARCLVKTLRGDFAPLMRLLKVPVVLPSIFTATALNPLADIVAAGFAWEHREKKVLDVSVFCGFAYADVPQIGFSVVVVTDDDTGLADRVVADLEAQIWSQRHDLLHRELVYSVEEGIARAQFLAARSDRPVVLLEHADRMNDSTWLLRAVLERGIRRVAVPYLWDPGAAERAVAAGEGATVSLEVGGRSSDRAGGPVFLKGRVVYAGDKSYVGTGPMRRGRRIDLGPAALIDADGVFVWVTSHSLTAIDDDCFRQFGLDPAAFDIIILRSKTHFRAVYENLAEEILIVDTPDWGPADLSLLRYRNVRSGVFPITAPAGPFEVAPKNSGHREE